MTGRFSGIRCFLATGQDVILSLSAADSQEAMTSESSWFHHFRRSCWVSWQPRSPGSRHEFHPTAIHLSVFSFWLRWKANLVFCSTATAAMQLPGEGNRITQSECAGGGREAEDELGSDELHTPCLQCSFTRYWSYRGGNLQFVPWFGQQGLNGAGIIAVTWCFCLGCCKEQLKKNVKRAGLC